VITTLCLCCCCLVASHSNCCHSFQLLPSSRSLVFSSLATVATAILASSCLPHAPFLAHRLPTSLHYKTTAMVYITSDLFGPAQIHTREDNPIANHWSIPADMGGLGKRKRHGEDSTISSQTSQRPSSTTRLFSRPPALPTSFESNDDRSYSLYTAPQDCTNPDRRPIKQLKRMGPKIALVKSTSHLMDTDSDTMSTYPALDVQHPPAVSDLRSCHACQSAPKRKKDLENYMDCRRCDERTCYICARQCLGGCGKKICKKCIVEVGQEGDSWCLDCYSRQINS
jgi:hypothetical protein